MQSGASPLCHEATNDFSALARRRMARKMPGPSSWPQLVAVATALVKPHAPNFMWPSHRCPRRRPTRGQSSPIRFRRKPPPSSPNTSASSAAMIGQPLPRSDNAHRAPSVGCRGIDRGEHGIKRKAPPAFRGAPRGCGMPAALASAFGSAPVRAAHCSDHDGGGYGDWPRLRACARLRASVFSQAARPELSCAVDHGGQAADRRRGPPAQGAASRSPGPEEIRGARR